MERLKAFAVLSIMIVLGIIALSGCRTSQSTVNTVRIGLEEASEAAGTLSDWMQPFVDEAEEKSASKKAKYLLKWQYLNGFDAKLAKMAGE